MLDLIIRYIHLRYLRSSVGPGLRKSTASFRAHMCARASECVRARNLSSRRVISFAVSNYFRMHRSDSSSSSSS